MAATATQIERLRRMVNEPTQTTYDDMALAAMIESYPVADNNGNDPTAGVTGVNPPVVVTNPYWVPTYDLHAAAADVWEEKAAGFADNFDFTTEGQTINERQKYENYNARIRYHRSRRVAGSPVFLAAADTRQYEQLP